MNVAGIHAVDGAVELDHGAEVGQLALRVLARLLRERGEQARSGLDEGDGCVCVDRGELVAHGTLQLGNRSGDLHAGGATSDDNNAKGLLGQAAELDVLVGLQQAPTNDASLLNRLHLQRVLGHPRNSKGSARAAYC
jgi:hypothetical protein